MLIDNVIPFESVVGNNCFAKFWILQSFVKEAVFSHCDGALVMSYIHRIRASNQG